MTRDETKQIVMTMYAFYQIHEPKTADKKTIAINSWHLALCEFEKADVEKALVAFVRSDTKGFPPTVGQIIALMNLEADMKQLNDSQAWVMVSNAIRKSGYYSEEEFEKLPKEVQTAVGSPGQLKIWAMDSNFNEGVESSNFKKVYRQVLERKKMISSLPPSMRPKIEEQPRVRIEKKEEQRQEAFERCSGEKYVKKLKRDLGVTE